MILHQGDSLQNGKYIITKKLGEGYFGITYKAEYTHTNKSVAIKFPNIHDNPSSQKHIDFNKKLKEVFQNEIKSLTRLLDHRNPYLVKFVEPFLYESDILCIVMEFVEGKSLDNLVKDKKALSEQDAIKYIKQVGNGLEFLHSNDLIHRDVHPGNILINEEKAILIDFGLARDSKSLYSYMEPTHAHKEYAAPELSKGSRKPPVDIYSLSASLYYAITGDSPSSIINNPQKKKEISCNVRQAIVEGMQSKPENRPESMEKWLELLPSTTEKTCVNCTKLEHLLRTGQWKKADIETYNLMLKSTGRTKENSLSIKSIEDFPCTCLCTINQLWVEHSKGHFGFSVQQSIWEEVGKNYIKYAQKIGWQKGIWFLEQWIKFSQANFSLEARKGHLPLIMLDDNDFDVQTFRDFMTALLDRTKTCQC